MLRMTNIEGGTTSGGRVTLLMQISRFDSVAGPPDQRPSLAQHHAPVSRPRRDASLRAHSESLADVTGNPGRADLPTTPTLRRG